MFAAQDCQNWNTAEYFKTATMEDVRACLDAGVDVKAWGDYRKTPLHWAAEYNQDPDVIQALLDVGAEVNARVDDGDTPLQVALSPRSSRNPAVIEALLKAGADPNVRGSADWTPLHNAAYDAEDADLIKALLEAGAELEARTGMTPHSAGGKTPLHVAVSSDAVPAAIVALVNAGADVDARDGNGARPLHWVKKKEVLAILLEAGAEFNARSDAGGFTPLHSAFDMSPAAIKHLVAAGADVKARNDYGRTPLHYVARENTSVSALELLLAAGADLEVLTNDGRTLLHAAAHSENPALIELLLKAGLDVDVRTEDGETPLHVAARYSGWLEDSHWPSSIGPIYGSTAVVEALLEAGADVNARNDSSWTPLLCASRFSENPAVIEVLLTAGADVDARNQHGATPLDLANHRLPLEIREVLRTHPLPPRPEDTDVEDMAVLRDCPQCPALVVLPAGRFPMGCVFERNACWSKNNVPTHEVDVPAFALSKFEVTRGQFAAFVVATGYAPSGGCRYESGSWRDQDWQSDEHPVVCVSWNDAQAYVQWLREETGYPYRLPTESEWEYAIRAGTKTRFYWGYRAPDLCKYVNSGDCDDGWERTASVGSFRANGFGLHDMAGNVSEWVEDCWHENYDGAPRDGSAWTCDGDCGRRVVRGGSWAPSLPRHYRSADRNKSDVGFRFFRLGFRVARTLDEP